MRQVLQRPKLRRAPVSEYTCCARRIRIRAITIEEPERGLAHTAKGRDARERRAALDGRERYGVA
jgi:hypothetical protein